MSLQAYHKVQKSVESPRDTEFRLFAQVTSALTRVKDRGVRDGEYVEALDWNRRMWSTFATDCSVEGNQLPDDLRARIISIGLWVGRYTSEVIRSSGDIDGLIDVNRAIMEGLAARGGGADSAGAAAPAVAPSSPAGTPPRSA